MHLFPSKTYPACSLYTNVILPFVLSALQIISCLLCFSSFCQHAKSYQSAFLTDSRIKYCSFLKSEAPAVSQCPHANARSDLLSLLYVRCGTKGPVVHISSLHGCLIRSVWSTHSHGNPKCREKRKERDCKWLSLLVNDARMCGGVSQGVERKEAMELLLVMMNSIRTLRLMHEPANTLSAMASNLV